MALHQGLLSHILPFRFFLDMSSDTNELIVS